MSQLYLWRPSDGANEGSARWVQSVTTLLAPGIERIPYEGRSIGTLEKLWKRVRRHLALRLGRSERVPPREASDRMMLWERLFFGSAPRIWPRWIDEAHLRDTVAVNPNAHLFWRMATLELFADAHLQSEGDCE